ncbi:BTAD domain-containing putative transcriptional regulator [Nakamurella aerolata]|uniref:AAA family ATPase n=1 Tax=Nakamurella aerolata TaxID=1656892 RepID=A0A849AJH8_9ACTN|nr:AAA family ATPase [Nakamurella aerolata]
MLGPIEVHDGTSWVPAGPAKCRAVLLCLVAHAPDVVSVEQLIDEVWGQTAPTSAMTQVHGYTMRLRRSLGRDGDSIVQTAKPGYRFTRPEAVDASVFANEVSKGSEQLRAGDVDGAREIIDHALALWRSAPDGALLGSPRASGWLESLQELHCRAREMRIDGAIRAGRHADVIADIRGQLAVDPLREQWWRLLLVALHRSGRQAEALAEYQRLRLMLADELGTEPGASLQSVHQQILQGTLPMRDEAEATQAHADQRPATQGDPEPVRQLPAATADFTGRRDAVQHIVDQLLSAGQRASPPIVVVHGAPGTGKTALAVQAARAAADAFPDAQLYLALDGTAERCRQPHEIQADLLFALGVHGANLPPTTAARAALVRSRLAGRRALLVLDDAGSEEQIRSVLPPDGASAVLVTTRRIFTMLPGSTHVELGPLPDDEALELLASVVGRDRIDRELPAARAIVAACGRLPLSVRIAGGKLLARPRWPLSVLCQRLSDETRRLHEMTLGDLDVRASVELSLRALPEPALRAFCLLGSLGPQSFPGWIMRPLLDCDDATDMLEVLVDVNLVQLMDSDPLGQPRYQLHDLLAACAVERGRELAGDDVRRAFERLLAGWLWMVQQANKRLPPSLFEPIGDAAPFPAAPVPGGEQLVADPLAWFDAERRCLLAAVRLAAEQQLPGACIALTTHLVPGYDHRARFDDWHSTHLIATQVSDPGGIAGAAVLLGLAQTHMYRGRIDTAWDLLQNALQTFDKAGHRRGRAHAYAGMVTASRLVNDLDRASYYLTPALQDATAAGDLTLRAILLCARGKLLTCQGRVAQAEPWFRQALSMARSAGDTHREAVVLREQAVMLHARGDSRQALAGLHAAAETLADIGDHHCRALALLCIAQVHADRGDERDANAAARQAATVIDKAELPIDGLDITSPPDWRQSASWDLLQRQGYPIPLYRNGAKVP